MQIAKLFGTDVAAVCSTRKVEMARSIVGPLVAKVRGRTWAGSGSEEPVQEHLDFLKGFSRRVRLCR